MVHFYIGDGKGKTSAALGLGIRAAGSGRRVYVAQFLKDKRFPCGETAFFNAIFAANLSLPGRVVIERFPNQTHPLFLKGEEFDKAALIVSVEKALLKIKDYIIQKEFDVIILDEILNVSRGGFCPERMLVDIITMGQEMEVVLTGRKSPRNLMKLADYVSVIKKVKHPFDKGARARKGIEY